MSTFAEFRTAGQLEHILARVMADSRYVEGITYGLPRKGHDEGSVANHIIELEGTFLKLCFAGLLTEEEKGKLLVLIHVHDTFKLAGKKLSGGKQVSLRDPRSHASLARAFLAEFTNDESVLAILQFHDEGHALWKQQEEKGRYSVLRLDDALRQIPDLELFLLFTVIDGWTASKLKDRTPKWFLDVVADHVKPATPFRAYAALAVLENS
jgi:hypothetical protein